MSAGRPIITAARLAEFGEALYGPHWQAVMADRLDVSRRTVARWRAGDSRLSREIKARLIDLLDDQIACLAALRSEVDDF